MARKPRLNPPPPHVFPEDLPGEIPLFCPIHKIALDKEGKCPDKNCMSNSSFSSQ